MQLLLMIYLGVIHAQRKMNQRTAYGRDGVYI